MYYMYYFSIVETCNKYLYKYDINIVVIITSDSQKMCTKSQRCQIF